MSNTRPATPQDIRIRIGQEEKLPDELVKYINDLIAANWNGHQSIVDVEVLNVYLKEMFIRDDVKRQRLVAGEFRVIKNLYRGCKWDVVYCGAYSGHPEGALTFSPRESSGDIGLYAPGTK